MSIEETGWVQEFPHKCSFCGSRYLYPVAAIECCKSQKGSLASAPTAPASAQQVGGDHYKNLAIQPVEFIHRNRIGFVEGNAIKYLCRWREKGGIEDLKKARHYIDLLIELEEK